MSNCDEKFDWKDGVSLKDYVDLRIDTTNIMVEQRFADSQRAIEKAESTMSKRLDGMNEFRDTLRDQAANFVTRTEHDIQQSRVDADVKRLEISKAVLEGKASQRDVTISFIMGAAGTVIGLVSLILRIFGI